jgi:hypothetical protein
MLCKVQTINNGQIYQAYPLPDYNVKIGFDATSPLTNPTFKVMLQYQNEKGHQTILIAIASSIPSLTFSPRCEAFIYCWRKLL